MAVYDDQKEKLKPESDGLHDDLGVHPERREAEVDDLEKLYNAESAPEKKQGRDADEKEQKNLDNAEKGAEPNDADESEADLDNKTGPKRKQRFSITGKQAAAGGGAIGLLVGSSIGFFTFMAGPLQFLQFAKLLERFHFDNSQRFGNSRTSKLFRYATGRPVNKQDFNLSRIGNKIAVHYEKKLRNKGIDVEYDRGTGRMNRMIVDMDSPEGKRMIQAIEAENGVAMPRDPNLEGNKVRLDFAVDSSEITTASGRRKAINGAVEAVGMNKISSAMAKRMLKGRARVDFHPLRNAADAFDEKLRLKIREQRQKYIQEGAESPQIKVGTEDPDKPPSQADSEGATKVSDEVADLKATASDPELSFNAKTAEVRAKLGRGVGIAGIAATVCGLQALGEGVATVQEANIVQPLTRIGMDFVITSGKITSGQDVSMAELGVLAENFYDKGDPETGKGPSSLMSAESIQTNLGRPGVGIKLPDSAKPGKDKPAFFRAIDGVTSLPVISQFCGAVNSTIGGFAFSAGSILAMATGVGAVALQTVSEVTQTLLANNFADDLVRFLAGPALSVAGATGGELGALADTGAFLANNNSAQGLGGRALTGEERLALANERDDIIRQENKQKKFYARMFDVASPDSLVSKSVIQNDSIKDSQTAFASLVQSPFQIFNSLSSNLASLNPKARAQTAPYDYGVDEYGFSIAERDSPELDNPYDNEEYIKTHSDLAELNKKYGEKCFGTTIDPATGAIKYGQAPNYIELEKIKDVCGEFNKDEMFLRYRMYIADTITAATIMCYESIDESACQEIGLTSNSNLAQTTENSGSATLPSGDAKALAQQILGNTKIGKDDDAKKQLEGIAAGSGPCSNVNGGQYSVDTELLRVIAALAQSNTFTISSLHRGCTASTVGAGTASRHWKGRAVDISGSRGINGVTMPSFDAHDGSGTITRFAQEAARLLPAGCELGVPNQTYVDEVKSINPACEKIFIDSLQTTGATGPHVHIGVP